eukprot:2345202-Amphidinium_carterae.1
MRGRQSLFAARRPHSQTNGSYVLGSDGAGWVSASMSVLAYVCLCIEGRALSLLCHFKIWGIFIKLITVHIVNTLQVLQTRCTITSRVIVCVKERFVNPGQIADCAP